MAILICTNLQQKILQKLTTHFIHVDGVHPKREQALVIHHYLFLFNISEILEMVTWIFTSHSKADKKMVEKTRKTWIF